MDYNPPSGTRYFLPHERLAHNWLMDKWCQASRSYNFHEYDATIVENASLYTRKGGDDILNEMFVVEGKELVLRPEMTPSVTHMAIQMIKTTPLPLRLFSIPQCWRNESISRGRRREFYQWNADIFGAEGSKYDVEILALVIRFLKSVKLTEKDVVLKISNRKILQALFEKHGVLGDQVIKGFNLVDKFNKLEMKDFVQMIKDELHVDDKCLEEIIGLLGVKDDVSMLKKYLGENSPVVDEMVQIFDLIRQYEIVSWCQFDVSVVRGLSYYTGMVFEGFSISTDLKRALCGGGRYDDLVKNYGYPHKIPCVGFGLGDIVITQILADLGRMPTFKTEVDAVVIPFKSMNPATAVLVAEGLRDSGMTVEIYSNDFKVTHGLAYADQVRAKQAILIFPDELKSEKIVVRDLKSSVQEVKDLKSLVSEDFASKILALQK